MSTVAASVLNTVDVSRRRGRLLTWLGLLALLAAVVGFGLTQLDGEPEPAVGAVAVPGGLLRIDAVASEEATHLPMAMPGMTHEEIGEGNHLLRVDATLGASDGSIQYEPDDFTVRGPGLDPVTPYRAVAGPGTVFAGMTAPLLLVYEVPLDVASLTLDYAGTRLALDAVTSAESDGHDHDDHDHEH